MKGKPTEQPPAPKNAGEYLFRVLEALRVPKEKRPSTVDTIVDITNELDEVEPDKNRSSLELYFARIGRLLQICDELDKQLTAAIPASRAAIYRNNINQLKSGICRMQPGNPVDSSYGLFPEKVVESILSASTELASPNDDTLKELKALKAAIVRLSGKITESLHDGPLRKWLLHLCREMESALSDFVIMGGEAFTRRYTAVVGEIMSRGPHFADEMRESPEEVRSLWRSVVEQFRDFAAKAEPIIKLAVVSLQAVLLIAGNDQPQMPVPPPHLPVPSVVQEPKSNGE
jgi:hypothetical protein